MRFALVVLQAIGAGSVFLGSVASAALISATTGVAKDVWPTIDTQQAGYSVIRFPYASNVNTYNKTTMLELVNTLRQTHDLGALEYHDALLSVAQNHAKFQASFKVVTHADTGGLLADRIAARTSTPWHGFRVLAENVGAGIAGEKEIIDAWASSPGHLANILHPKIQYMGVGVSSGYWVQDFASFGSI
ncbi:hypothetical protein LPJ72_001939 [Coemansia sp. Benny D160-2]|nr:hypothetical protein LPJ72_001939 [Coemansia sp. Benny D160-2]